MLAKSDLIDLFEENGIDYSNSGKEVLTSCPSCGETKHKLSFNADKEAAKCWVCGWSGHVVEGLRLHGIESGSNASEIPLELSQFLASRAFKGGGSYGSSEELVRRARMAFLDEYEGRKGVITFEYDMEDRLAKGIKLKFLDGQKPGYLHFEDDKDNSPKFYVADHKLFNKSDYLVIVEGEIDAITVAYWGYNSLATTGATKTDCVEVMDRFKKVYICFDNDSKAETRKAVAEARTTLIQKIREKNKDASIYVLNIPQVYKDVNEALQAGASAKDFKMWFDAAKQDLTGRLAIPASHYLEDMKDHLLDVNKAQGLETGIEGLDKALGGGERLGEIDALVAEAKSGKSSLYAQKMYFRLMQRTPIGVISRELHPGKEVIPNLLSIHFGVNFWKLSELSDERREKLLREAGEILADWEPLLFFQAGYGTTDIQEITQFIDESLAKGVKYFYLDHFHYATHDSENNKEVAKFAKDIKTLVVDRNIHLNLIIQPTKLGFDQKHVSYRNMRGSVAIEQAIDQAFCFYRTEDKNITCLHLEAARHKLAKTNSKIYFRYDPVSTRMEEVEVTDQPVTKEISSPAADYRIKEY